MSGFALFLLIFVALPMGIILLIYKYLQYIINYGFWKGTGMCIKKLFPDPLKEEEEEEEEEEEKTL